MQTTVVISISIKIISVIAGVAVFYFVSGLANERKKKLAEVVVSQIINFVLFIWLAKILLNLPLFLSDPLAVLAYPSDASAFYLAIFFSAILIVYSAKKGRIEGAAFVQALLFILLPASFVFEFAEMSWNNDPYAFGNIVLYAALLFLFLLLNDKASPVAIGSVILTGWTAGMLLLQAIQPHTALFGYFMEPWFIVLLFAAGQVFIFFHYRRSVINEHN